ncbi:hypothetical protein [Sporolactobacillus nakayamae]|uniref:Uncharacterized protein n=1 Tax=Sporolactobacillus nakayamae TaxID=269670 RepID=A0A1I2RCZ1_9BACL|nr:hypothetical protein [Sporolactobacillus nakayamae]SFG38574.1 hypothetical protein SAMN02982927_01557 [Sporolactobacillus nakayamae]
MFRRFLYLIIFIVAVCLAGIAAGMIFSRPLLTLLSAFAVIIFMWLGFMVKAMEQKRKLHK